MKVRFQAGALALDTWPACKKGLSGGVRMRGRLFCGPPTFLCLKGSFSGQLQMCAAGRLHGP